VIKARSEIFRELSNGRGCDRVISFIRIGLEHSQELDRREVLLLLCIGPTDEKESVSAGVPTGVLLIRFSNVPANGDITWQKVLETTAPIEDSPTRPESDLATIIYTSGTTGTPKGVMHSFAAFSYDARRLADFLGANGDQRALSYLPLAHIVERAGLEIPALQLGSRLFFTEGIETFLADLHRARPTLFLSVPRLLLKFQQGVFEKISREKLDKLLRLPIVDRYTKRRILRRLGLNTVIHAASGAAPLPTEILLWYRSLGLDLAEGYGMTETLITHLPQPGHMRPGYVGAALEGVQPKLGPNNELLIKSPMNMLGYFNDPEATRAAFTPDSFFRTGDIVELDPDGQLKIIGRLKEQFKTSKSKFVVLAPIESKLVARLRFVPLSYLATVCDPQVDRGIERLLYFQSFIEEED